VAEFQDVVRGIFYVLLLAVVAQCNRGLRSRQSKARKHIGGATPYRGCQRLRCWTRKIENPLCRLGSAGFPGGRRFHHALNKTRETTRGAILYGAGDARFEERAAAAVSTGAVVSCVCDCVCGDTRSGDLKTMEVRTAPASSAPTASAMNVPLLISARDRRGWQCSS
jgi:hypothetical protein